MSSNLIVPVPRETVQKWIARLNRYIGTANLVSSQSTFASISRAETSLHKAKELYSVLWEIKAMANWQEVEEGLNRIDAKIINIRSEKNKCYRPEVRRS